MDPADLENKRIDTISTGEGLPALDVLRLDLIHPLISGNKWFKLRPYLEEAGSLGKSTVLTFGGAYSNHIVATAAAARDGGFTSIGLIRGEEPKLLSPSLKEAAELGMQLYFLSREDYREKKIPEELAATEPCIIPEGGYGLKGAEGASEILSGLDAASCTHIITAAGTGTTLAGLVKAAAPHQEVIGISVLKNNLSLEEEVNRLLNEEQRGRFLLMHEYHFGGYAKSSPALLNFMNEWFGATGIPSDFVYTGKLFYAVNDLMQKGFFTAASRLLLLHTGGLQGNRSLPKGTLIF